MKIADIVKSAEPKHSDPETDLANLRAAIDRLTREREEAETALATLEAGRGAALMLEDDAVIDKLDKRVVAARRTIERLTYAIPRLQEQIAATSAAAHKAKCERHLAAARECYPRVFAAAKALVDANTKALELSAAATADVGLEAKPWNVALLLGFTQETLDFWASNVEPILGLREVKRQKLPPTVQVRVTGAQMLNAFLRGGYANGDVIALEPQQAREAIRRGCVTQVDDVVLPASTRSRDAKCPTPIDGKVPVLLLRAVAIPNDSGGLPITGVQPGDIVTMPEATATHFVRNGAAEFIETKGE